MQTLDNAMETIVRNVISGLKGIGLTILGFSILMQFLTENIFS